MVSHGRTIGHRKMGVAGTETCTMQPVRTCHPNRLPSRPPLVTSSFCPFFSPLSPSVRRSKLNLLPPYVNVM